MSGSGPAPSAARDLSASAQARPDRSTMAIREPSHDARRLRRMVDEHFEFVWRCLRRCGVPARDADDAAQEVFLVAHRKLPFIADGSERGFLFQTAARVASHTVRTIRRRREADDPAGDELPERGTYDGDMHQTAEAVLARRLLDEIVTALPADLRWVFILFELEGLVTDEIAQMLDIPAGTVASRLRRARAQFRALVQRRRAHDRFFFGAKR
ncbi:MAG: RNA polymerase sigma factor [Polyangiaceae bacterium]